MHQLLAEPCNMVRIPAQAWQGSSPRIKVCMLHLVKNQCNGLKGTGSAALLAGAWFFSMRPLSQNKEFLQCLEPRPGLSHNYGLNLLRTCRCSCWFDRTTAHDDCIRSAQTSIHVWPCSIHVAARSKDGFRAVSATSHCVVMHRPGISELLVW